jgi:hypothetical protein
MAVFGSFSFPGPVPGNMTTMEPVRDEPLPATLVFVFSLGGFILLGWFAMYALLRARW